MGEYADQIIKGESCELCMCPIKSAAGYPVTCRSCWGGLAPWAKKLHQRQLSGE